MINDLIIASSYKDRLASWKQAVRGLVTSTLIIDGLDTLKDGVARIKPQILLLDFDFLGLNGSNGAANLKRLSTETKIIILSGAITEDMEWDLFKVGVRGCCRNDIDPNLLNQVVTAVNEGELWIRRTLTCRLVDELCKTTSANKAYQSSLGFLEKLTQREYDIALRAGTGESNKQIAQSCGITERTVKAHLTEVYLKLGVPDRLNLALILSTDNRHQRRSESLVNAST